MSGITTNEHKLFYYPYASFTNAQLPLLKVAALYFDKLVLLDPVGASLDTIGADHAARDAVRLLKEAGILELVTPATVLGKYESAITDAIRRDMADRDFLKLCEAQSQASGKDSWTLSLQKVPKDLQTDQAMRHLMGDFARDVARETAEDYQEHATARASLPGNQSVPPEFGKLINEYSECSEVGRAYDESREGYDSEVEYRYANFPLALGEAIMMNHALFAGLLHAGATPIADDPFHDRALALKLNRVAGEPAIQQVLAARERRFKADRLAASVLTDTEINLPLLSPELPLEEILEYRQKHENVLEGAREKLGSMARRIEAEPWSVEFAKELEHKTIPDIADELEEVRKARDSWLKSDRGRLALRATGVAVGATAAVLTVITAPLTPIALATAGLGILSGTAIPGAQWLLDWRDKKKIQQQNGLRYLLKL